MKLRPAVQKFAEAMELELRKNDHKICDFEGMTEIMARTVEELGELFAAASIPWTLGNIEKHMKHTISEAADVANFLCMILSYLYHPKWPSINEKRSNDERR